MTTSAPGSLFRSLRDRIERVRAKEAQRVVYFDTKGWPMCPGCNDQSCTGMYLGRHCCSRCGSVVT